MSNHRVDNAQLLREIQSLRKEMYTKFDEIAPYIEFFQDVAAARKILAWLLGGILALGTIYLTFRQIIFKY